MLAPLFAIKLPYTPLEVAQRWPRQPEWPLAMVLAGDGIARWSILARCGKHAEDLNEVFGRSSPPPEATPQTPDAPPFVGGWIGYLGYELGWELEEAAAGHMFRAGERPSPGKHGTWPLHLWRRCDDALIHDHKRGEWWGVGCEAHRLADAVRGAKPALAGTWVEEALIAERLRDEYEEAVGRVKDYIFAGDVYQVNLAHRLAASFEGDALAMFTARAAAARPRYGGYLAFDQPSPHAGGPEIRLIIASLSPELFLSFDPTSRTLTAKPMKGTRPADGDEGELLAAAKDRAELAMIVDLLRNDLGRVSELGTVRVEAERTIERHGGGGGNGGAQPNSLGILQATASIAGRLRHGLTLIDALRACFPGGSITGAPKIRAMQIIDELEKEPRGPYCGAFGYVSDCGAAQLNIAIRTALIEGRTSPQCPHHVQRGALHYSVGAGIVADSVPREEWKETLLKAGVMGWGKA